MLEHGWNPDEEPIDEADTILIDECSMDGGDRYTMRINGVWYFSCTKLSRATLFAL